MEFKFPKEYEGFELIHVVINDGKVGQTYQKDGSLVQLYIRGDEVCSLVLSPLKRTAKNGGSWPYAEWKNLEDDT